MFFDLLGEKSNIATAHGKRLAAIMAIVARFNAIGEVLSTAPSKYAPIFQPTDEGEGFTGPWALGFTTSTSNGHQTIPENGLLRHPHRCAHHPRLLDAKLPRRNQIVRPP